MTSVDLDSGRCRCASRWISDASRNRWFDDPIEVLHHALENRLHVVDLHGDHVTRSHYLECTINCLYGIEDDFRLVAEEACS
ncbi:MAG: hypothetical protein ACI91B_002845 [Planctomycetota bacterium]|jgi:hypothetical protein